MSGSFMIKHFIAMLGLAFGMIVGEVDRLLFALIIFVCIDYLTGVIDAIYTKTLSSEVGYKGICKKVCIFMLVAVANIVDVYVIGSGAAVRSMVIFFYLANEGISILENISKLGIPIPEKLADILKNLDKED